MRFNKMTITIGLVSLCILLAGLIAAYYLGAMRGASSEDVPIKDGETAVSEPGKDVNVVTLEALVGPQLDNAIICNETERAIKLFDDMSPNSFLHQDERGRNLLWYCIDAESDLDLVKYLVRRGSDVNAYDSKLDRSLIEFVAGNQNDDVLKYLILEAGASSVSSGTPLHVLAGYGDVDFLKDYTNKIGVAEALAESKQMDADGRKPMHYAAGSGHIAIMDYLLGIGADLNEVDRQGLSPIVYTLMWKKEKAFQYLLDKKVNLDAKDIKGHGIEYYIKTIGEDWAKEIWNKRKGD